MTTRDGSHNILLPSSKYPQGRLKTLFILYESGKVLTANQLDTTIKLDFMVYEWMDTCLREFCQKPYILTPNLPQLIAQKVLEALKVMHSNGYIHGDVHSRSAYFFVL